MKIEQLLEKIGLKGLETDVFLTILKYNQISVGKIAKILSKPRSTIYSCVEKLKREQLLFEQKEPSGALYSARGPKELSALFDKRKRDIDRLSLDLKQYAYLFDEYQYLDTQAPKVLIHYGVEAIEVIQSQNPTSFGYFLWDIDVYQEKFQFPLEEIVDKFFEGESYHSKSIMVRSELAEEYNRLIDKRYWGQHQARFLKDEVMAIQSDTMLMDDRYLHISYKDPVTAIEVQNPTFFDAQKIMFEGLWSSLA